MASMSTTSRSHTLRRKSWTPEESALVRSNLNPILRVNKSASTSPTSTVRAPDSPKMRKIPFNVKAPKPSTSTSNDVVDVSSMSGNYAGPSSPRQSTFATDSSSIYSDRSRKSSTDSLRKYLDRATSPSPSSTSAPSLRPSKIPKRREAKLSSTYAQPALLRRRASSSSSSSIGSQASIAQLSPEQARFIRSSPSHASAGQQNDTVFPSSTSNSTVATTPAHSSKPSLSPSQSLDLLKSSLRGALATDESARHRRLSTASSVDTCSPRFGHAKRRSVSFALDVDQLHGSDTLSTIDTECTSESEEQAKIHASVNNGHTRSGSIEFPTQKRIVYPVAQWEPLTPEDSEDQTEDYEESRIGNALNIARSLVTYMNETSSSPSSSPSPNSSAHHSQSSSPTLATSVAGPLKQADASQPLARSRVHAAQVSHHHTVARHADVRYSAVFTVLETMLGLALAVIWLSVGKVVGYGPGARAPSHESR